MKKGDKVDVTIWMNWDEVIFSNAEMELTIDNLLELFRKYDPSLYSYDIRPYEPEEDIDGV